MNVPCSSLLLLACLLAVVPPAKAAEGRDSHRTDAVTIRLLAGPPDAEGRLRGALLIDLEPGWKTYWIDPAGPGLPPILSFEAGRGVDRPQLLFPAPERLTVGDTSFVGYDTAMAVAFTTRGKPDGRLDLSLLVGVCETLCVPVAAELSRDLASPLAMEDAAAIDRAFLALPPQSEGIVEARLADETLIVPVPDGIGTPRDLFVASPPGWTLGPPILRDGVWHLPMRPVSSAPASSVVSTLQAVAVGEGSTVQFEIVLRPAEERSARTASPTSPSTPEERP